MEFTIPTFGYLSFDKISSLGWSLAPKVHPMNEWSGFEDKVYDLLNEWYLFKCLVPNLGGTEFTLLPRDQYHSIEYSQSIMRIKTGLSNTGLEIFSWFCPNPTVNVSIDS
ncbi:hypothetical protein [Ekhidna sp.]